MHQIFKNNFVTSLALIDGELILLFLFITRGREFDSLAQL